jgi:hypothetical protein
MQFWMDREPGEVLSLAERDPAYELALAAAGSAPSAAAPADAAPPRNGLLARVLRRFLGRNGS